MSKTKVSKSTTLDNTNRNQRKSNQTTNDVNNNNKSITKNKDNKRKSNTQLLDQQSHKLTAISTPRTYTPQYTYKYNYSNNQLIYTITLQHVSRIPEKIIKFEPSKTHLYIDTLKHSKKYILNIQHPYNILIDDSNNDSIQADLIYHSHDAMLTCKLNVIDWNELKQKRELAVCIS